MKKLKKRVVNSYYAILYQYCLVPVLAILSFFVYSTLVIGFNLGNSILGLGVIALLVIANISLVYGISKVYITKIKLPLVYHIIVGAFTLVLVTWVNVYYNTVEAVSCSDYNATACVNSIINGKSAMLCLIACAAYYLIYIFLYKIVEKDVKKEAIA